jgi:hypothetical protein
MTGGVFHRLLRRVRGNERYEVQDRQEYTNPEGTDAAAAISGTAHLGEYLVVEDSR